MRDCPLCLHPVSSKAPNCPRCGHPIYLAKLNRVLSGMFVVVVCVTAAAILTSPFWWSVFLHAIGGTPD